VTVARRQLVESSLRESAAVAQAVLRELPADVATVAAWVCASLRDGGQVLVFGNGGSAADAQHFVAELVGFFERDRPPLAAVALTADTSLLTAIANDRGIELVFKRQLEALARPGDTAVAISTSGRSVNVVNALRWAQEAGIRTIGLTGGQESEMIRYCDLAVKVPSGRTARIQEAHGAILHAVCAAVEAELFGQ
jgi:D-sedoheptulose 7-phosphate isomerase